MCVSVCKHVSVTLTLPKITYVEAMFGVSFPLRQRVVRLVRGGLSICMRERDREGLTEDFSFAYCLVCLVIIISTICHRAYDK